MSEEFLSRSGCLWGASALKKFGNKKGKRMKKSDEEIRLLNIVACSKVQIGGLYRHKKTGRVYSVALVALREEDLEPVVVYSHVTSDRNYWTRPLSMFLERFEKMPPVFR